MGKEKTIVRCTIEMELVEGRDFHNIGEEEDAHFWAAYSFIDMLYNEIIKEDSNIYEWIQTKIIEEKS